MYYIIKTTRGYFWLSEEYYSCITSIDNLHKAKRLFKYEYCKYFTSLDEALNSIKTNIMYKNYTIICKVESLESIKTSYPELLI